MLSSIKIKKSTLNGVIEAPPSKSITHRALIIAALTESASEVHYPLSSEDTNATLQGLKKMGAYIEKIENGYQIFSFISHGAPFIDCKNSGTTLRLLTALASKFPEKTALSGDASLQKRPMLPLIKALRQANVTISSQRGSAPIFVQGPIRKSGIDEIHLNIRGNISSQFVSALLILAAAMEKDVGSVIRVHGPLVSRPYVNLTIQMLQQYAAAKIETSTPTTATTPNAIQFYVEGNYPFPKTVIDVPGDFSSAAFFLVAAVINNNDIVIKNLSQTLPQADAKILSLLIELGADIKKTSAGLHARGSELSPFSIDLGDSPDLFPILSVLAASINGKSVLYGAEHLKYKETNRIKTMIHVLRSMGVKVKERMDGCEIWGTGMITGGCLIDPQYDHRIAMAACIAATSAEKPITILSPQCMAVSYPNFLTHLKSLGGIIL